MAISCLGRPRLNIGWQESPSIQERPTPSPLGVATSPRRCCTWLHHGKRHEFNQYWAGAQPFLSTNTRFYVAKRAQVFGKASFYDQMRLARRFDLPSSLARRINAPTVIVQTALEQFYPGQSKQLYHWLHTRKSLISFTVAEGSGYHCEPMAPTVRNDAVLELARSESRADGLSSGLPTASRTGYVQLRRRRLTVRLLARRAARGNRSRRRCRRLAPR